jgi:hypothetical protein
MIPRIKTLGLVCALLAVQAIAASAAQAVPTFTSSAYPSTATGSSPLGGTFFSTEAGKVECKSHAATHAQAEASTTTTVTSTYTECKAFGFLSATVNNEGCGRVSHATEKVSEGVYRHHVDISCEAGKSIKVTAGTCKMEVKSQNGLTTVKSTNLAGGTITVQLEVAGIAHTVTQDGFACPFNGVGNKANATLSGDVVVSRVGGGSISVSG